MIQLAADMAVADDAPQNERAGGTAPATESAMGVVLQEVRRLMAEDLGQLGHAVSRARRAS